MRIHRTILPLLFLVPAALASDPPQVAVTFDDLVVGGPQRPLERVEAMTSRLLETLAAQGVPTVSFVNESKLLHPGELDARVALLQAWLDHGHELGNHTHGHLSIDAVGAERFEEDVVRGETVTRWLTGGPIVWFRHPYLRTGAEAERRSRVDAFLAARGYRIAPVTIDNSDWKFNKVWIDAERAGDAALQPKIGAAYLEHSWHTIEFAEAAGRQLFGRPIDQVLLLHANEINAVYLGDLLAMLRGKGYRFATLAEVLDDPAYASPDTYVGAAGVHWLFRWDDARGRSIDWKSEPNPPEWIETLYAGGGTP